MQIQNIRIVEGWRNLTVGQDLTVDRSMTTKNPVFIFTKMISLSMMVDMYELLPWMASIALSLIPTKHGSSAPYFSQINFPHFVSSNTQSTARIL